MPSPTYKQVFAEWLVKNRDGRGLSQGTVAKAIGLKKGSSISEYETADKAPEAERLDRLLDFLGYSVASWLHAMQTVAENLEQRARAPVDDDRDPTRPRATATIYRIAAGPAREAIATDETIELPADLTAKVSRYLSHCFALRIEGESMSGDDIHDGDAILVRRWKGDLHQRQIYVVFLKSSETATLKRVSGSGEILTLTSSEQGRPPLEVPAADVVIQGEYIGKISSRGGGAVPSSRSTQVPRRGKKIMPTVSPFHTTTPEPKKVYHDHSDCYEGKKIENKNRVAGTGSRPRCEICAKL